MQVIKFDSLPASHQAHILKIAQGQFPSVKTLESQMSDSLDFHDCHVSSIRDALAMAFVSGLAAGIEVGSASL